MDHGQDRTGKAAAAAFKSFDAAVKYDVNCIKCA